MNASHSVRDFFIIIEAILGCDRGVRPSGILDHLAAMMVEKPKVGVGGIDDRRYRFARPFKLLAHIDAKVRTICLSENLVAPETYGQRVLIPK